MKFIYKLIVIIIFINLLSCSKDEKKIDNIQETDQELEMISTYREGLENLKKGDPYYAAIKFIESEMLYPQSIWAPKSAIMASYSYYLQNYYVEAIGNLERYLETYPNNKFEIYAHFLIATCYYEMIVDEKKDIKPLVEAKKKYNFIISNYPKTDFAQDSKFKIDLINDILASKEMYIGRHYLKKEKWIAAINRFKIILDDYETTIYAEEAIHRLVEIYYYLGLSSESKKYASLLGYNYLSGEWYEQTYIIFNKDYSKKKIKKIKEKKGIKSIFKKLF